MKQILPAIKVFLFLTLVTGIAYPLTITFIASLFFHDRAQGSFVSRNNQIIGSRWIGQKFVSEKYFWGRPSSIDYNPLPSGGSNLGPTSQSLQKAMTDRADVIRKAHGLSSEATVPQALLFASGSGLDPEIAVEVALFQVERVAKARGIANKQILTQLIEERVQKPDFGFIGEARVNVLELNLALDRLEVQ